MSMTAAISVAEKEQVRGAGFAKRLLLPSLTDLFFILVFTMVFLVGAEGWQALLQDGDTGYHIRTGQYILATHQVPAHDLFSFSRPGAAWYAWEWLADVVFALLQAWAGLKGVVLFSAALLTAVFTLVMRDALRRGANSLIALGLLFMAINASYIHLLARPHIFTLLFAPVSMLLIAADRRQRSARIWLLVPLTVLWANLHGGFSILFPLLGLLVIGSAVEAYLERSRRAERVSDCLRYAGLSLACGLGSLINPYGIQLHKHIFQTLGAKWLLDTVSEFRSPSFHSGPDAFLILLFLAMAAVAPLVQKGKITEALWLGFLAYCALVSVRHIPIFALLAVPIVAVEVTCWWDRWTRFQSPKSALRIVDDIAAQMRAGFNRMTIWGPVLVVAVALGGWVTWPTDISADDCPRAMIQRHAQQIATARIFTMDQWGDYLIYHYYPRQRVFIDGRSDFYGQQMAAEYNKIRGGQPAWKELLDKYRFDMVLGPVDWPLATLLRYQPDWRVVDADAKTILFQKVAAP